MARRLVCLALLVGLLATAAHSGTIYRHFYVITSGEQHWTGSEWSTQRGQALEFESRHRARKVARQIVKVKHWREPIGATHGPPLVP